MKEIIDLLTNAKNKEWGDVWVGEDEAKQIVFALQVLEKMRNGLEITRHHIRRDGTAEIKLVDIADNLAVVEAIEDFDSWIKTLAAP